MQNMPNFEPVATENTPTPEEAKEQMKAEFGALALELSAQTEGFPSTGITEQAYAQLKATDEEYPGFSTPTDEILEMLKTQGMKIVPIGKNTGNYQVLPLNSDNNDDALPIRHLDTPSGTDEKLVRLVELHRILWAR